MLKLVLEIAKGITYCFDANYKDKSNCYYIQLDKLDDPQISSLHVKAGSLLREFQV